MVGVVRVQFGDDQLKYFKVTTIVTDYISKALRQTFKRMWDRKFGSVQEWDDSQAVRNCFATMEGGTTKIPTQQSYEEWDCTALFQATIFAQSFALPDSTGHYKTLNDLYVKPLGLPHGSFHASVVSSSGDEDETFALAIDQLRFVRNSVSHSPNGKMRKETLHQYVQLVKEAFKALGLKTDEIDAISSESGFPTSEVASLKRKIFYSYLAIGGLGLLH